MARFLKAFSIFSISETVITTPSKESISALIGIKFSVAKQEAHTVIL